MYYIDYYSDVKHQCILLFLGYGNYYVIIFNEKYFFIVLM